MCYLLKGVGWGVLGCEASRLFIVLHGIVLDTFLYFFCPDDNTVGDTAKTVKAPLGVEVMFGTFKKWGYQTLYQEDLCWYDRWGIGLTDLEIRRIPKRDSEFKKRYVCQGS